MSSFKEKEALEERTALSYMNGVIYVFEVMPDYHYIDLSTLFLRYFFIFSTFLSVVIITFILTDKFITAESLKKNRKWIPKVK